MPNPTLNSNVLCTSTGGAWSGSIVVASSLVSPVLILIGNAYDGGGTPSFTLGGGGTAFTSFLRRVYSSSRTAGIWYIINPSAGTYTLTQTAGSSSGNLRATVWDSVDQTTPLVNGVQGDILGSVPTLNVTVPTNAIAIDCVGCQFNDAHLSAQGSGQTAIATFDGDGSSFNCASSSYEIASGTVAMDWTGSTEGAHVGAALQYAAGGGGGGPVINDHNFRAVARGVGLGIGRGL